MFSLKNLQDMYAKIDYDIHHHRKNQKAYQQHTNRERNLKNGKHAAAIRKGKFPWVYYLPWLVQSMVVINNLYVLILID